MFYVVIEFVDGRIVEGPVEEAVWHGYLYAALEADDNVESYHVC